MNKPKTVHELLRQVMINGVDANPSQPEHIKISEAKLALLSLVLEALPKSLENPDSDEDIHGWNDCLQTVRERMEGLFK